MMPNTKKIYSPTSLSYVSLINIILFYIFSFILFYLEPVRLFGNIKFAIIWKMVLLFIMLLYITSYLTKVKKIELFVFFAVILSLKMLFNLSSSQYMLSNITLAVKNLMLPSLFVFFIAKLNVSKLIFIAKHLSIMIILSFIPYMLGILHSTGKMYNFEKTYGISNAYGLIGFFTGVHSASETLGFILIVLYYFFQKEESNIKKIFYILLLALGTYEIILTYARSGFLIAFVGLSYLWLKEKASSKIKTFFIFIIPILFIGIYEYLTNPVLQMRLHDQTKYTIESGREAQIGSGRLVIYKNAFNNWYESDIVGKIIGLGLEEGKNRMEKAIGYHIFAHNNYLQMLQQEGLIGLIIFLLYLFYLIKYIFQFKGNEYYPITIALILGYLFEMAVQGNYLFTMFLFIAIFLSLMYLSSNNSESIKDVQYEN